MYQLLISPSAAAMGLLLLQTCLLLQARELLRASGLVGVPNMFFNSSFSVSESLKCLGLQTYCSNQSF